MSDLKKGYGLKLLKFIGWNILKRLLIAILISIVLFNFQVNLKNGDYGFFNQPEKIELRNAEIVKDSIQ